MERYEQAKEMFARLGADTEAALHALQSIPVSVHCWQGDDVVGFDGGEQASGGIQTTGNYPGRARTPEELMADIRFAFSHMPGKKRLNLHASYAILGKDAGKVDRVYKVLKTGMICSVVTGIAFGLAVVLFSHQLLGIYTTSEAVKTVGIERLRIIILTYGLCGLMEVTGGVMRGIGYSVLPTVVTLLGVCVFRVIWVVGLLSIPAFHSVITVYVSYPVSWALTFGAHLACFLWVKKHVLSKYEAKAA